MKLPTLRFDRSIIVFLIIYYMQSANWKINHMVRYCVVDDIETFLFHATKCVKLEQIAKLPNSQYSTQNQPVYYRKITRNCNPGILNKHERKKISCIESTGAIPSWVEWRWLCHQSRSCIYIHIHAWVFSLNRGPLYTTTDSPGWLVDGLEAC